MIGLGFALLALALHAATAFRYGYFRDELYFIACSKHLAWGYVDQPPLVAFAAWLSAPTGFALLALRALPIAAAAGTVYLAVRLCRELGGGRFAQLLTGTATCLLPAYLLLGNTLTTTSFEPFCWTAAIYLSVLLVRSPERRARWWMLLALVVAAGGYAKYSILLPVVTLAAGLLLTEQRRALRSSYLVAATVLCLLALAPNLIWQAMHGWPIFEVLRGDATHRPMLQSGFALEYSSLATNAIAFAGEQLLYANPLAAPIWIAGGIAPFALRGLRDLRFIGIAYVLAFLVAAALGAKGYYIIGFYAALIAIGSLTIERAAAPLRYAFFAALTLVAIASMPLSLPVLSVEALIAYTKLIGLTGRSAAPAHLMQPLFAEEFGWNRLAHDVAAVYDRLPPAARAQTAIYADTYGDAGALDFYGPAYGLPPAISSQNSYYLWGTRGYSGATLLAVGASRIELLRHYYRSVVLAGESIEPYKWIVEGPAPIYLCRDPIAPLPVIWPALRWYGA